MSTSRDVKLPKQVVAMLNAGAPAPAGDVVAAGAAGADAGEVKPVQVQPKVVQIGQPHNFEQMYQTLKGKYDAEVPALMAQNRELRAELEQLKAQPPVNRVADLTHVLTDEEREELGEEVLNPTAKMIEQVRAESAQELHKLRKEVFLAELSRRCPQVGELNFDPAFHAWLNEVVPLTGQTRFTVLREAEKQMDAVRCADVFNAFLAEKSGVPARRLSDLAVPRPAAGGTGKPVERPVYTESQVKAFYEDLSKGKFRRNPEEAIRLADEIKAADAEGRIVKG